jgi:membrane-associated phospholipid phosphatase
MSSWIPPGLLFFVYIAVVAGLLPGLAARRRLQAAGGAAAGLVLCAAAWLLPPVGVLDEWILPPVALLLSYWTSGLVFVAPMPPAERALERIDGWLRIDAIAAQAPRWVAELLEASYTVIYPLIPLALAIHLTASADPSADRFWTVILITDFICFGFLPWVQTRPPRARRSSEPWRSSLRRFNLRLLDRSSIQVNTFPSGHAAEALAAALLVADAPWPLTLWMSLNAVLVSAGAVFGRYHYAADALAGWVVAIGVWLLV